jgi:hypothetical protein
VARTATVALSVAAAFGLAAAVSAADQRAAPRSPGIPGLLELRKTVRVERSPGNRWTVTRRSTAQLLPPWGPALERACREDYSFRIRRWTDRGCAGAVMR